MAELPLHPRLSHMLLNAVPLQLAGLACEVAALLSERDIVRCTAGWRNADLRFRLDILHEQLDQLDGATVDRAACRRVSCWTSPRSPRSPGTASCAASWKPPASPTSSWSGCSPPRGSRCSRSRVRPREHPTRIKACFLGYSIITPAQKLHHIRTHSGFPNDWSSDYSDSELLPIIAGMIELSQYLKEECAIYNIPYFDTSRDFAPVLDQVVAYISAK